MVDVVGYSRQNRWQIAAMLVQHHSGRVLDIGARDRVMTELLNGVTYLSADRDGEHDYLIDLEGPLNLPDRAFDVVLALDVIEHVDNIHGAFAEILRLTDRAAVVSLPNMASYTNRAAFARRGHLPTDKYALPVQPRADRHRWLPVAHDIVPFFEENAHANGFRVGALVWEAEGQRISRRVAERMLKAGMPEHLLARRAVAYLVR